MQATAPIAAEETLVTLPRAAALLLTPKMRCPFPEYLDVGYWDTSPWCVGGGIEAVSAMPSICSTFPPDSSGPCS